MTEQLRRDGRSVNRKRVSHLMAEMGRRVREAVYRRYNREAQSEKLISIYSAFAAELGYAQRGCVQEGG